MKDIADCIRFWTPFLNDKERYDWISGIHVYSRYFLLLIFFITKNFYIRLLVLICMVWTVWVELYYRECPLTLLENEFHIESWDDIIDIVFKKFDWKLTRLEKTIGFTCFNFAILISFTLFTFYEQFYC